ncbi:hypothetical protein PVAP13_3KG040700 [Panicum virgatum]|uniref:Uncharacterized protein n=1 Tax=Panicum virgatum TaxID=38727 RepID=A0A8T0USQ1_PANVG|nr:hypothetical protein PVAP13_3KG040700 [Panicum virgatum]
MIPGPSRRGYKLGSSVAKRGSPCPPQEGERAWSSPRSSSSAGGSSGKRRRRRRHPRPPATDRPGGTRRPAPPSREGGKAGTCAARLSRPRQLRAMGLSNGAPWRRRWPAANDYASGF